MCGITGFWQQLEQQDTFNRTITSMTDSLIHRGPDDGGVWVNEACGLGMGNRRLAIIDLSPAGHMPMVSKCGQYVLAYNGEIYNFMELRQELEADGYRFRSQTDTEAILEGCVRWGVKATLEKLNGMFAFALWDGTSKMLTLARDRMGIKPLYYGWSKQTFIFGSELKAFHHHPDFSKSLNRDVLALYLRYSYIPEPYSIYNNVYKLPPGHYISLNQSTEKAEPVAYWDIQQVAQQSNGQPFAGNETEAIDAFDTLLKDAVKKRMVADVPLGAFLSGGVDSSAIVSLMQAQSEQPVKTFTIGFQEKGFDESAHAKAVAAHLGTDHTELLVTPEQAQAVIPNLATIYDEPFADVSQIPMYLVSELTRKHVTVSLSGDGGDELFAGYSRYLLRKLHRVPSFVRLLGSKTMQSLSTDQWDRLFKPMKQISLPGDKLHKLSEIVDKSSFSEMYRALISNCKSPENCLMGVNEPSSNITNQMQWQTFDDPIKQMMFLDLITYLPGDILTKVDRASMAVSLEARVPMLDHRVVAFAWTIPLQWKIQQKQTKWLLRQMLYRYVPKDLIERPKMGFGVPIGDWLRGPLRDWAEDLLDEHKLKQAGIFRSDAIHVRWHEHLSGKRNWQNHLWDVLMFQAWHARWFS